jgi:hypothetical protein
MSFKLYLCFYYRYEAYSQKINIVFICNICYANKHAKDTDMAKINAILQDLTAAVSKNTANIDIIFNKQNANIKKSKY